MLPPIIFVLFEIARIVSAGDIHFKEENRLKNIRQLTFGGQNAEGYFSYDGKWLTFQASGMEEYGTLCDQIYRIDLTLPPKEQIAHRLSTGLGTCTCSYFYPDNRHVIYAGTFQRAKFNSNETLESCPQKTCNGSYTWDLFPEFDIFKVNEFGKIVAQLTESPGYDAEGAVSPDGRHIVFTSTRSGDPDIWIMNSDGTEPKQLTNELGYDGGPFFSPDGTKICFRASRPNTSEEIKKYKTLLSYNLVAPTEMELYTMNLDGGNLKKVTSLGGSNWAPFYLHDGHRIIFSSNFNSSGHFGAFDLYIIDEDGGDLERVTYNEGGFDAFPMFDVAGRRLVWGSSRNGTSPHELNLFIADWIEMSNGTESAEKDGSDEDDNRTKEQLKKRVHRDYDSVLSPQEPHLKNVRQMTFDGINGQAYFSYDDKSLVYQALGNLTYGTTCDQIYVLDVDNPRRLPRRLSTGYDAEASVSNDGRRIVFTSMRSGDPEIWIMNWDGSGLKQLTSSVGYDGGASFSHDDTKIIFRASRPKTAKEINKYKLLLKNNLVEPTALELYVMNSDGSNQRRITSLGGANWSPAYLRDNRRILFASNFNSSLMGSFNLYTIYENGTGLEQITFTENEFNGLSSVSFDGDCVTWSSNGGNKDLNIYVADWSDRAPISEEELNQLRADLPPQFSPQFTSSLFPVSTLAEIIVKGWDMLDKLIH
ncbi:unnamed protein product [Anisakis simplex]|uniref:Biopolymer transporter Tol n=1 Tax=Anisakis simplex TaxID=6269 RepID=A0A0M3K3Q1_ANISI|nr:unnamed protein product [Anisakis simplex]